jgi:hypothetical protein
MKATSFSLRIAAALIAFALPSLDSRAASDQKTAPKPADLQVLIDVPPTWRPFLEDDIADALSSRLMNTFQRRGYAGKIEQSLKDVTLRDMAQAPEILKSMIDSVDADMKGISVAQPKSRNSPRRSMPRKRP